MHQLLAPAFQQLFPGEVPAEYMLLYLDLTRAYGQKHRGYHNLTHLAEFNRLATDLLEIFSSEEALAFRWAMFYHDYVYIPTAKDNERKSADKAVQIMTMYQIAPEVIARTEALIMATATHDGATEENSDPLTDLFLDCDVCILAAEPDRYREYCEGVRKEFNDVPESMFNLGRLQFVNRMVEKDFIFRTSSFRDRYENRARHNLQTEAAELKARTPVVMTAAVGA